MTELTPYSIEGYEYSIVAVDCFNKCMEIYLTVNKAVAATVNWLWREFIPCFGKPYWLHIDLGQEFRGEFVDLCDALGITN